MSEGLVPSRDGEGDSFPASPPASSELLGMEK